MDLQLYKQETRIDDPHTNLFRDEDGPEPIMRAVRSQADNLGDWYSLATGSQQDERSETRQEFKEESDINNILARYQTTLQQRPVQYGTTVDYSMDLQQAKHALASVQGIDFKIPPELAHKYRNWRDVLNGAESGEYQHDLQNLVEAKKRETEQKAAEIAAKQVTEKANTPPVT